MQGEKDADETPCCIRRLFKKAARQDLCERRAEEETSLRVGRSPLERILANGKTLSALATSENLFRYVESLNEARALLANFFDSL